MRYAIAQAIFGIKFSQLRKLSEFPDSIVIRQDTSLSEIELELEGLFVFDSVLEDGRDYVVLKTSNWSTLPGTEYIESRTYNYAGGTLGHPKSSRSVHYTREDEPPHEIKKTVCTSYYTLENNSLEYTGSGGCNETFLSQ